MGKQTRRNKRHASDEEVVRPPNYSDDSSEQAEREAQDELTQERRVTLDRGNKRKRTKEWNARFREDMERERFEAAVAAQIVREQQGGDEVSEGDPEWEEELAGLEEEGPTPGTQEVDHEDPTNTIEDPTADSGEAPAPCAGLKENGGVGIASASGHQIVVPPPPTATGPR